MTATPPDNDRIAWLADRGAVLAVRVLATAGGRVDIEDGAGTHGRVAAARLLWVGGGTSSDAAGVAAWEAAVRARADGLDVPKAWQTLCDTSHLDAATLPEIAARVLTDPGAVDVDALGVAFFSAGPHFKLRGGLVHPAAPDKVEAALAEAAETARVERAARIGGAALAARLAQGDPDAAGLAAGAVDAPEVEAIMADQIAALSELACFGREAARHDEARRVRAPHGGATTHDPAVDAFDALVGLGAFGPDENLFVRRANVATEFTPQVLDAAAVAAAGPPRGGRRRADLTALLTVAIDDPGTTEIDDAFALDGDRIVVMVADTAGFVRPGGPLYDVAMERVSTLYLPDRKVPMLPPAIGQGAASLQQGQERPCLAFSMELGASGQPIGFHVEEATCRVDVHLTYRQADAALAGDAGDLAGDLAPGVAPMIRRVADLMRVHAAGRLARGALQLQRKDVVVDFPEAGVVRVRAVPADGPGRELIGELMVAVGSATGVHCSDQSIPCIYRTQAAPTGGPRWDAGRIDDVVTQIAILRALQPSALAVTPGLHSTLGLQAYTQVTSPLRRLGDLLMHEQLKSTLKPGGPRFTAGELKSLLPHLQLGAARLRRIEASTRQYWSHRYLAQEGDRVWDAVATRQTGRRWKIELTEIGLQAELRHRSTHPEEGKLRPGTPLRVRVVAVDARRGTLELAQVRDG